MAFTNVTRQGDTHEKKGVSQMVYSAGSEQHDVMPAGNYLVGYLPPRAIINDSVVWTSLIADAGAITVGTTEGGAEILSLGDSGIINGTGTFAGKTGTGTGVPVYVTTAADLTLGAYNVVVEYIELTLNTGDLTQVD